MHVGAIQRFMQQKDGIFEKIFRELNLDADTEYICIDSTAVKVHESANGGEKKGSQKP